MKFFSSLMLKIFSSHLTWKFSWGVIHSTKIQTGPTRKSGPPQKVDLFFRNFSSWTEPIHWVLDRNFPKFWFNGSRPWTPSHKWSPLFQWTCTRLNFPLQKGLTWYAVGYETWFMGATLIEMGVYFKNEIKQNPQWINK